MKKAILLGAVMGVAPMVAMAADLAPARVVSAAPVIVQFNQWGGFYGGVSFGWHNSRSNSSIGLPQAATGQPGFVGDIYRGEGFLAAHDQFAYRRGGCDSPCVRTDQNFVLPGISFDERTDGRRNGFVGSLNAGYNWQSGSFVFGVEADVSFLNNRNRSAFYGAGTADYQFDTPAASSGGEFPEVTRQQERFIGIYDESASLATSARMNWLSTARLRAGFAAGPVLLYATGGLALGGVQMNASGFVNEAFRETRAVGPAVGASPGPLGTAAQTLRVNSATTWDGRRSSNGEFGWTVGLGAEWMMTSGFSLKAEYLYYALGDQTLTASGVTTTTTIVGSGSMGTTTTRTAAPITIRQNLDGHIFRVGLNFGFPVAPRPAAPVVAAY